MRKSGELAKAVHTDGISWRKNNWMKGNDTFPEPSSANMFSISFVGLLSPRQLRNSRHTACSPLVRVRLVALQPHYGVQRWDHIKVANVEVEKNEELRCFIQDLQQQIKQTFK